MENLQEICRIRPVSAVLIPDADTSLDNASVGLEDIESDTELAELKTELSDTKDMILDKASQLQARYQQLVERRVAGKEDIQFLFADLKEILARKEREMLSSIDTSFGAVEDVLSKCLGSLSATKQDVEDVLLKSGEERNDESPIEEMRALLDDVQSNISFADQVLEYELVPQYRVNFVAKGKIEDLELGTIVNHEFENVEETNTNEYESVSEVAVESTDPYSRLENGQEETTSHVNGNEGDVAVGPQSSINNNTGAVAGTMGFSSEINIVPSAPPLPQCAEEPEEASPPPYWQAVGLSGPHETLPSSPPIYSSPGNMPRSYMCQSDGATYSDQAPSYFDSNMSHMAHNKLELWHSFPINRQHDARSPMPVALSWNFSRICIADRSNKKLKFFSASGGLLAEMNFPGSDIYDVGFLEAIDTEARYIVTVPKMKTLVIISIRSNNSTQLVRKMTLRQQYTSICRGSVEQTLLGADALPKIGPPRVDVIDFYGVILRTITNTPDFVSFAYPKAIEVFEDHIAIADWKLNRVCVYLDDGTPVGQYGGTPSTPLIRPIDLTLDQFGNIMILDGELFNIHVIDQQCAPIEVIKVPKSGTGGGSLKLAAFDDRTKRLVVVKSTGDLAIFEFKGGYNAPRQGEMPPPVRFVEPSSRPQLSPTPVLPLVEGMLPSTIESIARPRSLRTRQFNL